MGSDTFLLNELFGGEKFFIYKKILEYDLIFCDSFPFVFLVLPYIYVNIYIRIYLLKIYRLPTKWQLLKLLLNKIHELHHCLYWIARGQRDIYLSVITSASLQLFIYTNLYVYVWYICSQKRVRLITSYVIAYRSNIVSISLWVRIIFHLWQIIYLPLALNLCPKQFTHYSIPNENKISVYTHIHILFCSELF